MVGRDLRHHGLDRLRLADVERVEVRGPGTPRLGAQLLDRRSEVLLFPRCEDDRRPELSQLACDSESDTCPAAGDDADPAVKRFVWKHDALSL